MKTVTFKSDSYELPFKITCTVSGVVKTYTSEEYVNKKIEQHGTLEAFRAQYVSKSARKTLKKQKSSNAEAVAPAIPMDTPVVDNRPIAKKDSRGILRNAKGHPIKKGTEDQYKIAA